MFWPISYRQRTMVKTKETKRSSHHPLVSQMNFSGDEGQRTDRRRCVQKYCLYINNAPQEYRKVIFILILVKIRMFLCSENSDDIATLTFSDIYITTLMHHFL